MHCAWLLGEPRSDSSSLELFFWLCSCAHREVFRLPGGEDSTATASLQLLWDAAPEISPIMSLNSQSLLPRAQPRDFPTHKPPQILRQSKHRGTPSSSLVWLLVWVSNLLFSQSSLLSYVFPKQRVQWRLRLNPHSTPSLLCAAPGRVQRPALQSSPIAVAHGWGAARGRVLGPGTSTCLADLPLHFQCQIGQIHEVNQL